MTGATPPIALPLLCACKEGKAAMSSRQWLEEQAAKALRENPGLIDRHELMRRMKAQKDAEREAAQRATEHVEKMAELREIRRLLEERKGESK